MTQGYDGPLPGYYVQSSNPQTPNLGLTLIGVDPIVAYNFVLIDMFAGAASGVTSLNGLAGAVTLAAGSNITITPAGNTLTIASTATGAVTSVGLTMPAIFSVAGSPVTSSGTLAVTLATETANRIWAGPTSGGAATPTFRSLVTADLPAGVGTVTSVTFTGDGTVLSSTPSSAVTTTGTLTAALANAAGGTVFGRNATTTGAPSYTSAPVLGIPGTSTGTIALASSTASGKFTITAPASASTPTLTLPTTSNVLAGQFAGDGVIYSASLVTASAAGTLTLPSPSNQNANIVFAGPSSGGAATPSFRALVAADIASGTVLWNTLGNASGALTLANGTNASTFNHTSAVAWTWANTTSAVVGTPQNSPSLVLSGQYFATGNITGTDTWTIAQSLTAGLNGASALTFTHSGSTGAPTVVFPNGASGKPSIGFAGSVTTGFWQTGSAVVATGGGTNVCAFSSAQARLSSGGVWAWSSADTGSSGADTGISRLGAASIAIGTQTAGDFTGTLKFTTLTLQGKIGTYNAISTIGNGVPSELVTVDLTAQSAAIGTTTLYAVPASGVGPYRVSVYAKITTAGGISSVLGGTNGFQLTWTDPTDSTTPTVAIVDLSSSALNANTTTTVYLGSSVIYTKASTNIQYAFDYTSAGTAMQYKISIRVEAL